LNQLDNKKIVSLLSLFSLENKNIVPIQKNRFEEVKLAEEIKFRVRDTKIGGTSKIFMFL